MRDKLDRLADVLDQERVAQRTRRCASAHGGSSGGGGNVCYSCVEQPLVDALVVEGVAALQLPQLIAVLVLLEAYGALVTSPATQIPPHLWQLRNLRLDPWLNILCEAVQCKILGGDTAAPLPHAPTLANEEDEEDGDHRSPDSR